MSKIESAEKILSLSYKKPLSLISYSSHLDKADSASNLSFLSQDIISLVAGLIATQESDSDGWYFIPKNVTKTLLNKEYSFSEIQTAMDAIYHCNFYFDVHSAQNNKGFSGKTRFFNTLISPNIDDSEYENFDDDVKGQFFIFNVNPQIIKDIKQPNLFANLKVVMVSLLAKGKYANNIYEYLSYLYMQASDSNSLNIDLLEIDGTTVKAKSCQYEVTIPEFRKSIRIPEEKYQGPKSWGDFNRHVMKKNIDLINKRANIFIKYEKSRKTEKLLFTIYEKPDWKPAHDLKRLSEVIDFYNTAGNVVLSQVKEKQVGSSSLNTDSKILNELERSQERLFEDDVIKLLLEKKFSDGDAIAYSLKEGMSIEMVKASFEMVEEWLVSKGNEVLDVYPTYNKNIGAYKKSLNEKWGEKKLKDVSAKQKENETIEKLKYRAEFLQKIKPLYDEFLKEQLNNTFNSDNEYELDLYGRQWLVTTEAKRLGYYPDNELKSIISEPFFLKFVSDNLSLRYPITNLSPSQIKTYLLDTHKIKISEDKIEMMLL
jgi:hypothetical protein